jgi:hypothetical protein
VAANRPHPLTSPASQPAPRATGAQPITARPIACHAGRVIVVEPTADRGEDRVGREVCGRVVVDGRRPGFIRGRGPGPRRRAGRCRRRRSPSWSDPRRSPPTRTTWYGWVAAMCEAASPERWAARHRRWSPRRSWIRAGLGRLPGRADRAATAGAPRPGLVLRPVLAGVRVLLGVDRPVGARGRPVPGRPAPVGCERLGIDVVVRGRSERRLLPAPLTGVDAWPSLGVEACRRPLPLRPLLPPVRQSRSSRRGRPTGVLGWGRAGRTRWPTGAGPRTGSWSRPATVRPKVAPARSGSASHGLRGAPSSRNGHCSHPVRRSGHRRPGSRGTAAGRLPGGVGMVGLHEPPIGALHLVEGRASLESERAIRVVGWHRSCRGSWTSPLV